MNQEIDKGSSNNKWCHHWSYKYLFLFLISSIRFASNFCVELPSGLENTIIKVMGVTTAEYDLLYSVSAWPSIVLCLVGGLLIDKLLGLRLGLLIVVSSVLFGQIVWAVGGLIDNYIVMLVGRFFIGAGNDLTVIIDHAFKAIWFKEDLQLAISIDASLGRLGGGLALVLPQMIYNHFTSIFDRPTNRLSATLFVAAGGMLLALIFSFVAGIMDYTREKKSEEAMQKPKSKGFKSISLKCVKQFRVLYWLGVAINITYFPILFSFVSIGQVFFVQKYRISVELASLANFLVFGSATVVTLAIGVTINQIGFRLYWMLGSILAALAVHNVLMFGDTSKYIPFIAGVLYSVSFSALGPILVSIPALLIDREYLATAYGIYKTGYNAVVAIMIYVTGLIVDNVGYFMLEGFYTMLVILCVIFVLLMIIIDTSSNKPKINFPSSMSKCGRESGEETKGDRKEKDELLPTNEDKGNKENSTKKDIVLKKLKN